MRMWRFAVVVILALAGGLSIRIHASYRRSIRQARERIASGSQIVETPGGPLEYAVVGDGMPVLAVHGAGGGYDQGLDLTGALAQGGFRVIVMSRFGYLRTPLPDDASPAAQADFYASLLDALNIRRAAVVGFSAAAPSAMQFALRHAERTAALVLVVPAAFPAHLERSTEGALPKGIPAGARLLFNTAVKSDFVMWAAFRLAPLTMSETLLATPREVIECATADERARFAQVLNHLLPFSQRRLGVLNDASITPFLPRYQLEEIEAPALILGVADDLFGTYEGACYSAEHIPHARFISFPSGGHLVLGHFSEASNEIASFLRLHDASDRTSAV